MAGLLFAGLAGISVVAAWLSWSQHYTRQQERFERLVDDTANRVGEHVGAYGDALAGIAGLFGASERVTRDEFRAYVSSCELTTTHGGALGFGYVHHVRGADVPEFLERVRTDGAPAFTVLEFDEPLLRADRMVVQYIEPEEANRVALGLDIGTEASRREAAERARDTGRAAITARIHLFRDHERRTGFLILRPVYRGGVCPDTVEARRASLAGWVFAPVEIETALGRAGRAETDPVSLRIYDGPGRETLLHDDRHPARDRVRPTFEKTVLLAVGGRAWSLRVASTPAFDAGTGGLVPWMELVGGLAVSGLLSSVLLTLAESRSRAVSLAQRMTLDLRVKTLALEAGQSEVAAMHDASPLGMFMTDASGRCRRVNRRYAEIAGIPPERACADDGTGWAAAIHPEDRAWVVDRWNDAVSAGRTFEQDLRYLRPDGTTAWVSVKAMPVRSSDGGTNGYAGAVEDISLKREAERRRGEAEDALRLQATHDRLTGLLNRQALLDELEAAVVGCIEGGARPAVLFLDFDRFKSVNDTMGHKAGDALLVSVADRLTAAAERDGAAGRPWTLARLGGDEFVVILRDAGAPAAMEEARAVCARLATPHRIGEHEVISTASIGVAVCGPGVRRGEEILQNADAAMYQAKRLGRSRCVLFDETMREEAWARYDMERALVGAVARGEFTLVYQPLYDLSKGGVVALEAFLRWRRAGVGEVPPAVFLPLASASGLSTEIDEWVAREACAHLAGWRRADAGTACWKIVVNLTRRSALQGDFTSRLSGALREHGLRPADLVVDLPEGVWGDQSQEAKTAIAAIKLAGVGVAVDDFGAGRASLEALLGMGANLVKVDAQLLTGVLSARPILALFRALITLTHDLGGLVLAEGVETAEQLASLQAMECDWGQGRHLAVPLPAAEVLEKLIIRPPSRRAA